MHYRRLGRSGLKVSEISFGTWITFGNQIEEQVANDLIHTAYDAGVNFSTRPTCTPTAARRRCWAKPSATCPARRL